MKRFAVSGLALAMILAIGLSTVSVKANDESAPSPQEPIQILNTAELMKLFMDPIYEDLKDAVENPPEGRATWRALYVSAYTLAETNNLMYSRVDEDWLVGKEDLWKEMITEARDINVRLAESIKTQSDYEVIKENYLAVVKSCNDCHEVFESDDPTAVDPPRSWMD